MSTVPHSYLLVPITQVETAIIDRLKTGLGKMAKAVAPYRGELDKADELLAGLPGAWVSFGGATLEPSGRDCRWVVEYVVMVGGRNPRSQAAARTGGPAVGEVGVNMLIWAANQLLANQSLGLKISPLKPRRVETVYNTGLPDGDMAVFALHFATQWQERVLDDGEWPDPLTGDASHLFEEYKAQLDTSVRADHINLTYQINPASGQTVASDLIQLEKK